MSAAPNHDDDPIESARRGWALLVDLHEALYEALGGWYAIALALSALWALAWLVQARRKAKKAKAKRARLKVKRKAQRKPARRRPATRVTR